MIVTADHGHLFFMDDVNAFNGKVKPMPKAEFEALREKLNAAKKAKRLKAEAALKAKQQATKEKATKRRAAKKNATEPKAEGSK